MGDLLLKNTIAVWYTASMFVYIFAVVAALLIVASMPKPQSQPPATFDSITAPTAEEGRAIPVLFGTRVLSGPNVVWYGDFRTEAIRA